MRTVSSLIATCTAGRKHVRHSLSSSCLYKGHMASKGSKGSKHSSKKHSKDTRKRGKGTAVRQKGTTDTNRHDRTTTEQNSKHAKTGQRGQKKPRSQDGHTRDRNQQPHHELARPRAKRRHETRRERASREADAAAWKSFCECIASCCAVVSAAEKQCRASERRRQETQKSRGVIIQDPFGNGGDW